MCCAPRHSPVIACPTRMDVGRGLGSQRLWRQRSNSQMHDHDGQYLATLTWSRCVCVQYKWKRWETTDIVRNTRNADRRFEVKRHNNNELQYLKYNYKKLAEDSWLRSLIMMIIIYTMQFNQCAWTEKHEEKLNIRSTVANYKSKGGWELCERVRMWSGSMVAKGYTTGYWKYYERGMSSARFDSLERWSLHEAIWVVYICGARKGKEVAPTRVSSDTYCLVQLWLRFLEKYGARRGCGLKGTSDVTKVRTYIRVLIWTYEVHGYNQVD